MRRLMMMLLLLCFACHYSYSQYYEVHAMDQGVQGTILLKVFSYAKDVEDAKQRAKFDALHAVLFHGVAGSNLEEPIVKNMDKNVAYFNDFFGTDKWNDLEDIDAKDVESGKFLQYINVSTDGSVDPNDVMKIERRKYKVGVVVSVNHGLLRERLVKDGIIKEFAADLSVQKPSIMVVPSDDWCSNNGYMQQFENAQGEIEKYPDYEAAIQNDSELMLAISKIGEMFAERNFPLKDLGATLDKIESDRAAMQMTTSSESFSGVKQSPTDMLNQAANADIILKLSWIVNKNGPRKSITFNIMAIDSYISEQITGASGTGPELVSNDIPLLIEEAVVSHMDNLQDDMQRYFADLRENGRKTSVKVLLWQNAGFDLENYCNDKMYIDLLYDWMLDNTVNGAFSEVNATRNMINYERVRIPMEDDRGRPYNARQFGRELRRYLEQTCDLQRKVSTQNKGLGEVWIFLGEQ